MPTGLTRDVGWQIGVSRALPHPLPVVWDFISSPGGLALWPGPGAALTPERGAPYRTDAGVTGEVRGYRPATAFASPTEPPRSRWPSPRSAEARTMLRFHQDHLASTEEREQQRAHWRRIMDQVAATLGQQ